MNLTSQDEQVACFQNVAAHLQPGGCFVIEVGIPDLQRLPPGETVRAFTVTSARLGFDEYDLRPGTDLSSLLDRGWKLEVFCPFRYVWPAELDLMARPPGCPSGNAGAAEPRALHQRQQTTRLGLGKRTPDLEGAEFRSG